MSALPLAAVGTMFMDYSQIISNVNTCHDFLVWTTSAIRALRARNATQDEIEKIDTKLNQLKQDLWKLKLTVYKMRNLIDQAEWKIHNKDVAEFLPRMKDVVYDAEDLLDEHDYWALTLKIEWTKSKEDDHLLHEFQEFFDRVESNDYIARVNEIQEKLDYVHAQSPNMVLQQTPKKFDKSVRPETTSLFRENIFGREKELKQLLGALGVPSAPKRARTESEKRMTEFNVLSIVGMGGIGKTTMAKQICNDKTVKKHFQRIIWICVSDDFDTKRLAREIMEHVGENTSSYNNLNVILGKLGNSVMSKRILLVLDDVWDDALKDDGAGWKQLCESLTTCAQGSMILVTTRSPEVANLVGPMNRYELKGLQDNVFWDFFKQCAFGEMTSLDNKEKELLECIGKNIITKLKGSPLAAKTIGRLLRMDLSTSHWENIMMSDLWEIEQTETDILPALRLSYMYLSQKLKRCFSICAMYPKDHKFQKDFLADIWVAQGYVVDPQEALQCFVALANRSFFQKASPRSEMYVIHDLMHDTAQLISKDECFTIKHASDIDKVPSNVRHLSIFTKGNVTCSELKRICDKKKLRSLVCDESYSRARDFAALLDLWFKKLLKIRVLKFKLCNVEQLPESMGDSKHLRYLCLLGSSKYGILPSSVSRLHHLKIIERSGSELEKIPPGFSDAISLQEIRSKSFTYKRDHDKLFLEWLHRDTQELSEVMMDNQMEVIPHRNLQHLSVEGYQSESCPSWFRPNLLPGLCSLKFRGCDKFKSVPFFAPPEESRGNASGSDNLSSSQEVQGFKSVTVIRIEACSSLASIPLHVLSSNAPFLEKIYIDSCWSLTSIGICGASSSSTGGSAVKGFSSLAQITIEGCHKLLSLDEFLTPDYLPVVKTITVGWCFELTSLSVDRLDGLQDLEIYGCPKLHSQRAMTLPPSLKKLNLRNCRGIESIIINNTELRSSSELESMKITDCSGLKSIGGTTAIEKVDYVLILGCSELKEVRQGVIIRRGVPES